MAEVDRRRNGRRFERRRRPPSRRDARPGRRARIEVSDGALIPGRGEKSTFSAWRISFFGALIVLVGLFFFKPHPYRDIMLFLPDGILKTFEVTLMSIVCALVVGLFAGLGRISRVTIINRIATIYVEVIRGIPLLVQIFYIYYALGKIIQVPDIFAAVIAMTVCYGAYLGEIFRAGIQSIHKGQMEAAIALGLTRGQALRQDHPSADRPGRASPAGQRVHRASEGLVPRFHPRRLGSPAPRTGVRLEDIRLLRGIHRGRPGLPRDDAVFLPAGGPHGRKDEPPWQIGYGSSTRARTSARSSR